MVMSVLLVSVPAPAQVEAFQSTSPFSNEAELPIVMVLLVAESIASSESSVNVNSSGLMFKVVV